MAVRNDYRRVRPVERTTEKYVLPVLYSLRSTASWDLIYFDRGLFLISTCFGQQVLDGYLDVPQLWYVRYLSRAYLLLVERNLAVGKVSQQES